MSVFLILAQNHVCKGMLSLPSVPALNQVIPVDINFLPETGDDRQVVSR